MSTAERFCMKRWRRALRALLDGDLTRSLDVALKCSKIRQVRDF